MPRYTEQLNECTNPVAADWLQIVDVSAAAADKDRKLALGKLAILSAANEFTTTQIMPRIVSVSLGAIADDGVVSFTPSVANGILVLLGNNLASCSGIFMYRCGGGSQCSILAASSNTILATMTDTVLTGTTGTDGKVTVSAVGADGRMYIENRRGGSNTFYSCLIIGG